MYATRHSLRSAASHSILIGAFIYCGQLAEIYRDKTEPINPFKYCSYDHKLTKATKASANVTDISKSFKY